jgi:hypothetical protein
VLDLQAGVHLEEVELAAGVEHELDGAGADVGDRPGGGDGGGAHALAQVGVTAGEGASSTTFWWRRWTEQSRSPRWMTWPWVSPNTWISTWRPSMMARSRISSPLPNADSDSERAERSRRRARRRS